MAHRGATLDHLLAFLDQQANPHGPIIEVSGDSVTFCDAGNADDVEVRSRAALRCLFNRHRKKLPPPA
jgi:hypothetical protein